MLLTSTLFIINLHSSAACTFEAKAEKCTFGSKERGKLRLPGERGELGFECVGVLSRCWFAQKLIHQSVGHLDTYQL
jgi:hypothetical protein